MKLIEMPSTANDHLYYGYGISGNRIFITDDINSGEGIWITEDDINRLGIALRTKIKKEAEYRSGNLEKEDGHITTNR